MNVFKRLSEKIKDRKERKQQENNCWYNNSQEKKRSRWHNPDDGGYYDTANHEIGTTSSIGKRQH